MIKANGHIKDGKLRINKTELPVFLHKISIQKNKTCEVIVKFGSKRSTRQNAYYWGVIVELIRLAINEANGENFTKDDIHVFLKNRFIEGVEIANNEGEVIIIKKSTADNTKTMQEEYHDLCRKFAREFLNVEIPLPNENLELKFN
jgi:hypothetical protein